MSDGDLYAYRGQDNFHVHVTGSALADGKVKQLYIEPSAQGLLARMLWLGEQGCDYPWDALRLLKQDVVAKMAEREADERGIS